MSEDTALSVTAEAPTQLQRLLLEIDNTCDVAHRLRWALIDQSRPWHTHDMGVVICDAYAIRSGVALAFISLGSSLPELSKLWSRLRLRTELPAEKVSRICALGFELECMIADLQTLGERLKEPRGTFLRAMGPTGQEVTVAQLHLFRCSVERLRDSEAVLRRDLDEKRRLG